MANVIDIPLQFGVSHDFFVTGCQPPRATARSRRVTVSLKEVVFAREHDFCRCCGFASKKYQEVLVYQGRVRDVDSMATVCVFCHQCFNLDQAAVMNSGTLIWLPEITQAELHHVARDVYRGRITKGVVAARARQAFDRLNARRDEARARLGTNDPGVLAGQIRGLTTEQQRAELTERLDGIRLFPLDRRIIREAELEFNMFPQILAYWRSRQGPFAGDVPYQWLDRFYDVFGGREEDFQVPVEPQARAKSSHAELSARLLREAAGFFRKLASNNPVNKEQMETNAGIFEQVAELVAKDPAGRVNHYKPGEEDKTAHAVMGAKLLRDAADFFHRLSKQNVLIEEQMSQNANVYKQMAALLERDPTGFMD